MYECGKLKKVIGNKILFRVILEQCVPPLSLFDRLSSDGRNCTLNKAEMAYLKQHPLCCNLTLYVCTTFTLGWTTNVQQQKKQDRPCPPIYLNLIFDILKFEILSLMNWIFAGYTGSKNPVQTGKKIQFIKLEI